MTFEHVCDQCSASVVHERPPRPWTMKSGRLVRIESVLIRLLWLLPSVVNERGTIVVSSPSLCCLLS